MAWSPSGAVPSASVLHRRGGGVLSALSGVVGFAALTALLAQVAIPIPGTPVPVTLQTVGVLLAGIALGARRGAASQTLYVAAGAMGLPVFAGARGGLTVVTAGYLLGFVLAALVVGHLYRRFGRSLAGLAALLLAGSAIILGSGVAWLAVLGGDVASAAAQGLWPFLPAEALKVAAVVGLVRAPQTARCRLDRRAGRD